MEMVVNTSSALLQLSSVYLRQGSEKLDLPKLKPINLRVFSGERVAVLGPSGAGKSTLLHLMSLEQRSSQGEVTFKDRTRCAWSIAALSEHRAVMPQHCQVAFGLDAALVIGLGRVARTRDPFLPEIVYEAAKLAHADHLLHRRLDTLSGGECARVHLARVFAQLWDSREGLVLVDEPLSTLDPGLQENILQALDTYANDRDHAIISVLHDMNHALHACDRLLLIKEGNLYADIPSNRDALPLLEDLYGLQLEYVQTTSQALFVSSRMTRRCVA